MRPDPTLAGSMVGGFEFPPRRFPPTDPQHKNIPQTYDPRVAVQLERIERDLAAGKPGLAAREDAERAPPGGGLQPVLRAIEEEGEQRDTPVTFTTQFASYYAGETASFTAGEAERLAELGVTTDSAAPGEIGAPVNTAVPHVSQAGSTLNCTMGIWSGEPSAYAYQWKLDGADAGTDAPDYSVVPADVGKSAVCVVTASNAAGATAAPPSNAVVVV